MHQLRFRRPVLGRLIWGWLGVIGCAILVFGLFLINQSNKSQIGRIALNVEEELTLLAPPPSALVLTPPPTAVDVTNGAPANAPPLSPTPAQGLTQASADDDIQFSEHFATDGVAPKIQTIEEAQFNAPAENSGLNSRIISLKDFPDSEASTANADEGPGKFEIRVDGRKIDGETGRAAIPTTVSSIAATPLPALNPALTQTSTYGEIPQISLDGDRAAQFYAKPFKASATKPKMGLIVGGLGLNRSLTERAIKELPANITLSFAPYSKNLDQWMKMARDHGHEVILELPMEGYGSGDPKRILGTAGLLTSHSTTEIHQRLDWLLSRGVGYFAVTNYLGSKFSSDEKAASSVLEKINASGLAYFDDTGALKGHTRSPSGSNSYSHLKQNYSIAHIDMVIPPARSASDREITRRKLKQLQAQALSQGYGFGKITASALGLDIMVRYFAGLDQNKIELAPASALLYAKR